MNKIKKFISLLLTCCLLAGLCACGGDPSDNAGANTNRNTEAENTQNGNPTLAEVDGKKLTEENVVGTGWQCTYYDNEDKVYTRFTLSAESDKKEYKQIFAINGLYSHSETGTYEVKDGKLHLHPNGDSSSSAVYELKNGKLLNSGKEFEPYTE